MQFFYKLLKSNYAIFFKNPKLFKKVYKIWAYNFAENRRQIIVQVNFLWATVVDFTIKKKHNF